jgi:putative effector of murein hydrolase LrgA (UPF0299 family)
MKKIVDVIFNISIIANIFLILNSILDLIEIPGYIWGLTLFIGAVTFLLRAYYYKQSEKDKSV